MTLYRLLSSEVGGDESDVSPNPRTGKSISVSVAIALRACVRSCARACESEVSAGARVNILSLWGAAAAAAAGARPRW